GTGSHLPIYFEQGGVCQLRFTNSGGLARVMVNPLGIGPENNATTPLEVNGDFSFVTKGSRFYLGSGSSGTEYIQEDNSTGDILLGLGASVKFRFFQGGGLSGAESPAPTGAAGSDLLWPDSGNHRWQMNNNAGGADFVVGQNTTDTLANKTLASPTFTGTPDASGATQFKLPVAAGYASAANGEIGYDSTN